MVWVCNEQENAVIDSLKKVYQWRSTRWWNVLHTMMKENPENRTGRKHKWGWHMGHDGYTLGSRERPDDLTRRAYFAE